MYRGDNLKIDGVEIYRPNIPKEAHRRVKMYALRNEIQLLQAYGEIINYVLDHNGIIRKGYREVDDPEERRQQNKQTKAES